MARLPRMESRPLGGLRLLHPGRTYDAQTGIGVLAIWRGGYTMRRPTVASWMVPASTPAHTIGACRTRKCLRRIGRIDVQLAIECRDIVSVPVKATLPHVAMHVVESPGVRLVGTNNRRATYRRSQCWSRRSATMVVQVTGKIAQVRIRVGVLDRRAIAPKSRTMSRTSRKLPLRFSWKVEVEPRLRTQNSKE